MLQLVEAAAFNGLCPQDLPVFVKIFYYVGAISVGVGTACAAVVVAIALTEYVSRFTRRVNRDY